MMPGVLEQAAEMLAAARNATMPERATYAAWARNRLEQAREQVRLLDLSLKAVEATLSPPEQPK